MELSKRLKISKPTVSQIANRGEKAAMENRENYCKATNQYIKERP